MSREFPDNSNVPVSVEPGFDARCSVSKEEHLRLALEAGRMGWWEWDVNSGEVTWSEGLERIHGLTPGSFKGTFDAFKGDIHPEDLPSVEAAIESALAGETEHYVEYRVVLPDANIRWVEGRGRVFRDAQGRPQRLMGVCADITDRKQAEETLAKRARIQSVLYELTDRLHKARDLDEVYNSALDSIMKAVESDRASLLLYDDQDVMRFVGWRGLSDGYRTGTEGHSPWGREETECEPICFDNVEKADFAEELEELVKGEGIRALCFIPLMTNGRLIGKFMVYYDRPHQFTADEVDLVLAISRQLATGIEYKQAEAALIQNEQSLRLALEAGRMGTWEWNVGSELVRWSPGLESLYGYEPGTFPGTMAAYRDRMHPEDRERQSIEIQKTLADGTDHDVEHRILWADGSLHWVEGRGKVFRDASGQAIRMVGVSTDITERKLIERDSRFLADASASLSELVSAQDTLQKLADLAVPDFADWCAVDMLDDNGNLMRVAVAHVDPGRVQLARQLHEQYPSNPETGQGVWKVIRDGQSELVGHIDDAMLEAAVTDLELLRILRKLGLRSYMGVPLRVRGRVLGAITFIAAESGRTYTERELAVAEDLAHRAAVAIENGRLYQELKDADRRKDAFLATLAHELRNPLAPMRHAIEIISSQTVEPTASAEARVILDRQLDHMVRLVDDLLDISRISQDKLKLQKIRTPLDSIIHQAREAAWPVIAAQHQELLVELPGEPVAVYGDRTRLVQVLSNLLNNASKFSDPKTKIHLRARLEDRELVITVTDEGVGIAPEMLPRVFEMFAQADHVDFRRQTGLGIGLSLAKRLIELHGGSITAASPGVGLGSVFAMTLPIIQAAAGEQPTAFHDKPETTPLKVLVVDDNVDAARMLSTMLGIWGHQTDMAHDGEAAVEMVRTFKPDLVLMDIGLPVLNGYEAAVQIRSTEEADLTLVAVSGWGQDEDRQRSREAGFNAHLVKPVSSEALQNLIADLAKRQR